MSIENNLASIAKSLETIAAALSKSAPVASVVAAPAPAPAPVASVVAAPTPAPVVVAPAVVAPTPAPVVAVPFPETPVPTPIPVQVSTVTAPFADARGMMTWVMEAYKALGAEKGVKIQDVLKTLGHANINDVRPDQYAALYAGIEGLK